MKRIVHIVAILGIVLPALVSCKTISSFLSDEETVAEAGSAKLYRSELNALIPKGIQPEDSTRLARQYINAWALDQIFLTVAQKQLSKTERDVTKELEDYRQSLLKYRYEQLYVNERLDTAVSEDNVEAYYTANINKFELHRPIVKARYLKMSADSPVLPKIRKKMSSDQVQDLVDADSLAYSSALKFTTWGNRWIDVASWALEFGTDYVTVMSSLKGGWMEMTDSTGVTSLAFVSEIVREGETAPLEYCTPQIKDMIISARKQNLITSLEQDLLKDAREKGQFVIY
jgi:hypothetical protein